MFDCSVSVCVDTLMYSTRKSSMGRGRLVAGSLVGSQRSLCCLCLWMIKIKEGKKTKKTACLVSRSSTWGCCWNVNCETRRVLRVPPCPSFSPPLYPNLPKTFLNQPKIHSGWIKNADAEITLQYDVSERSNVLCLMVVLVKKNKKKQMGMWVSIWFWGGK